jgi:hypothetical protein
MISRSDDYVEYCRETAKHARDLYDLALRGPGQQAASLPTCVRCGDALSRVTFVIRL